MIFVFAAVVHMLVPELFLSSQCSMLSDRKKERKLIVNEYHTIITYYGLLKISVLFDTSRKLKNFAVKIVSLEIFGGPYIFKMPYKLRQPIASVLPKYFCIR